MKSIICWAYQSLNTKHLCGVIHLDILGRQEAELDYACVLATLFASNTRHMHSIIRPIRQPWGPYFKLGNLEGLGLLMKTRRGTSWPFETQDFLAPAQYLSWFAAPPVPTRQGQLCGPPRPYQTGSLWPRLRYLPHKSCWNMHQHYSLINNSRHF